MKGREGLASGGKHASGAQEHRFREALLRAEVIVEQCGVHAGFPGDLLRAGAGSARARVKAYKATAGNSTAS